MRVNRLLSILLIISNKGTVTGQELADHFEVSLRTIYRDIDKISEAGIPIASIGGKGGGFYIMESYDLDKLFLSKNELQALVPIMDNLRFLFGKNKQFNDIVLKLENAYKNEESDYDKLSINISHFSMENELKEYLYIINKAIEDSKLLKFNYINRNMEYIERITEPIKISFVGGHWYLTAYCRTRGGYRKFKLVRIKNVELGDSFIKRNISNEELERVFNDSYDNKSIKVKLKFTNKIGEQLTEYFVKDIIKRTEDGNFIVEQSCPYEDGLFKFILSFGKECEVIEPGFLRKEVKKYLSELVSVYTD